MKSTPSKPGLQRGVSLVEVMVSIGVLAVAAPLALAALMRAGEGTGASRAETRAPLIVENCMSELAMARKGSAEHLPAMLPGEEFGRTDVLCLAFGADGGLLGRIDGGEYDAGAGSVASRDAYYLATLQGAADEERTGFPPMLQVKVTIEYPSIAPSERRRKMEFFTKLP
jgi:prepilin-type N-terminal cleavage/methylation domain-containing protein